MSRQQVVLLACLLLPQVGHSQCTAEPPPDARTFAHRHKVHNFNGEPPTWLEDKLALWSTSAGTTCFVLNTWSSNGHECGATGSLRLVEKGRYRFDAGVCSLNFAAQRDSFRLLAGDTWRRWGEGGVCPQKFECGMYGSVSSGLFVSQ
jgi:hypothetical protein